MTIPRDVYVQAVCDALFAYRDAGFPLRIEPDLQDSRPKITFVVEAGLKYHGLLATIMHKRPAMAQSSPAAVWQS